MTTPAEGETPYDQSKRQAAGDELDGALAEASKWLLKHKVRMPSPASIAELRVTAKQAQKAMEDNKGELHPRAIKVMAAVFGSVSLLMELQDAMGREEIKTLRVPETPKLVLPPNFRENRLGKKKP